MAGIGFKIEKILSGDTYFNTLKAHFYSAVISSGPWLMSIITLFCLGYFSPSNIKPHEIIFFRTIIIYIFAFSLIVAGFLHLSLTRYLSDKFYSGEKDALAPAFNSAVFVMLLLQAAVGITAMSFLRMAFFLKFLTVMIYVTISLVWVAMIFLTALRNYKVVCNVFVIASLITVAGCKYLGGVFGLEGYFLGYLVGHLIIAVMLSARIFIEFDSKIFFDQAFFLFLRRNKILVFSGIFYNLAVWIDKIIFWFSPNAIKIKGFLYSYPKYESATFFAFLTIIPALSVFLIKIETNFYRKYKIYYGQILGRGTFSNIIQAKKDMINCLRKNITFVVVYQGIISLSAIIFAFPLADILHLKAIQIPVFRLAVMGAYLNVLLLMALTIMLYFDFKKTALWVTIIFFAGNALGTLVTIYLPVQFTGYGYVAGAFISLIAAFYSLNYKLKRLEYLTFASQPLNL